MNEELAYSIYLGSDKNRDDIFVIYGSNNLFNDVRDLYLQEFEQAKIEYNENMDFWKDKDMRYKKKMSDVYNEQVKDLMKVVPEFKVANAVIHYDETSPHMHIIGVPINFMKKTLN